MKLITFTKNDNLRYTLSPTRQELVYEKLMTVLPQQFSSIFLKPKLKSHGVEWYLPDSSIEIFESHTYSQLGTSEQNLISEKLKSLSDYIQENLKEIPELKNRVKHVYDIPGIESAKLLKTSKGNLVVLSDWAFVRFDKKKGYLPFEKIINKPGKEFPVNLIFAYSDNSKYSNQTIEVKYMGFPKKHETDQEGKVSLGELPAISTLEVRFKDQNNTPGLVKIMTEAGQEQYKITIPFYTSLLINVKDQKGNTIDGHPLTVISEGTKKECIVEDGKIFLEGLIAGKTVNIIDSQDEAQMVSHTLSKEDNEVDFIIDMRVPTPPPPQVLEYLSFYVYDFDGELIKNAHIFVQQKNKKIELENNSEGVHKARRQNFVFDEKAYVFVKIKREDKEEKLKKRFKVVSSQDEYHLKLEKNYWWLLLLLIPLLLLLLLSLQKSITVQLEDEVGNRVEGTTVEMNYSYNSLFNFNSISFFDESNFILPRVTNKEGNASFEDLPYTLYDRIFSSSRQTQFIITTDDKCYADTMYYHGFFNLKDTIKFKLPGVLSDLDIKVLSRRTSRPVSNAEVVFILESSGADKKMEGLTDDDGMIIFKDIAICGNLKKVIAQKVDYFSDSIVNKSIAEISSEIKYRTLYLNEPTPCNDVDEAGDVAGGEVLFNVPKENQTYVIKYNFKRIKDRLVLYAGSSTSGTQIYDTGWVNGKDDISITPKLICGGCDYVTAKMMTNNDDTAWSLFLECP